MGAGLVSILEAVSFSTFLLAHPQFQKGFQLKRGVLLVRHPLAEGPLLWYFIRVAGLETVS